MGGFECSTHRNYAKKRIDVIRATRHDELARRDYERLIDIGIRTARDGIRWHLIEKTPYEYDFSSAVSQVRAARHTELQVIWDLFHYGFPDHLDLFSPAFVDRFAAFAESFTKFLLSEGIERPYFSPINEISFFSWAAGTVGIFYPYARRRGPEIKRQLVRATIAATERIKRIAPNAVFIQTDPAINVLPLSDKPYHKKSARAYHKAQFHALDMLIGQYAPEIGGHEKYLEIVGVNYYFNNQWRHPGGQRVLRGNPDYKPFHKILADYYGRYRRPLFIAETGIENEARAEWFRHILEEVRIAESNGIPIYGICLYPIVNHPGWDDNRHCYNGLWDYADESGSRRIYEPLAEEIRKFNTAEQGEGLGNDFKC